MIVSQSTSTAAGASHGAGLVVLLLVVVAGAAGLFGPAAAGVQGALGHAGLVLSVGLQVRLVLGLEPQPVPVVAARGVRHAAAQKTTLHTGEKSH